MADVDPRLRQTCPWVDPRLSPSRVGDAVMVRWSGHDRHLPSAPDALNPGVAAIGGHGRAVGLDGFGPRVALRLTV